MLLPIVGHAWPWKRRLTRQKCIANASQGINVGRRRRTLKFPLLWGGIWWAETLLQCCERSALLDKPGNAEISDFPSALVAKNVGWLQVPVHSSFHFCQAGCYLQQYFGGLPIRKPGAAVQTFLEGSLRQGHHYKIAARFSVFTSVQDGHYVIETPSCQVK